MEITFAADPSLGKLAKWLRILGFDTLYDPVTGANQVQGGVRTERVLLTRTRRVQRDCPSGSLVFILSNDPIDQLREVIKALNLSKSDINPFSRCVLCNTPIEPVQKEAVLGRVPDYVWESETTFRQCRRCRKIYWSGSHTSRSLERINHLFDSSQAIDI